MAFKDRDIRHGTSGVTPGYENASAAGPIDPTTGQHTSYWVLNDDERRKGFVRPVRESYVHSRCGAVTRMAREIAETYARDPSFYGATFCVRCRSHFPVGAEGEFTWDGSDEKVGT